MVERYNIYPYDQYSTDDRTSPTGAWVRYEDYEALEAQLAERDKACVEWSEVSQRNYQRAKAAEQALAAAVNRLTAMRDDEVGYRHVSHFRRGAAVTLASLDHPAPAPTPSLDDVVKAALEFAANEVDCGGCYGTCMDPSNCNAEDARIIRAAASDPDTIAVIIKTAGGEER